MNFFAHLEKRPELLSTKWHLIGKGPSFQKVGKAGAFVGVTIGLNHVAGEIDLDYWHVFDVDVFDSYDDSIIAKVGYLVVPHVLNEKYRLPLYPHQQHRAMKEGTESLISSHPLLGVFHRAGRLLVYKRAGTSDGNNDSASSSDSEYPHVCVGSYSASTVVNLLAVGGVQKIQLVGIDGGNRYAETFSNYEDTTLLDSGNESFDQQFSEIAKTKSEYELSIHHINAPYPVPIYVGAQKEQRLAFEVLAYSISRHASIDVSVIDLDQEIQQKFPDFAEVTKDLDSGTPFSFQRFAIPYLMGFRNVGIYLDSDMLVFDDVRKLLTFKDQGDSAVKAAKLRGGWHRKPQLSVLVIDSGRCSWDIHKICRQIRGSEVTYQQLFNDDTLMGVERSLPHYWNSLEDYQSGLTCLIHYTDMRSQPWLSPENRHANIWCKYLIDYVSCSSDGLGTLEKSVEAGWVRPGLLQQVAKKTIDPIGVGIRSYIDDYLIFSPPYLGHAIIQLERRSSVKLLVSVMGKGLTYLFVTILVRARFVLKIDKLSQFLSAIFKSLKDNIIYKF